MGTELKISEEDIKVIQSCQSVLKTSYDDRVLVRSIADSIALPKTGGYPVCMADVLQIVRIAVSMHLDPVLGGIWGYKDKNGRLVCGVTKKGWQQALHSQPDYAGIEFKNNGLLKSKRITLDKTTYDITYYESCTCYITKIRPDGREAVFTATAYFDEEFMANKEPWLLRPKRMLEGRAMTICASNAYGWGAYDNEEVKYLKDSPTHHTEQNHNVVDVEANVSEPAPAPTTTNKAKALINKSKKDSFLNELSTCQNREELTAVWRKIPKSLQADSDLKNKAQEIAQTFSEE